MEARILPEYFNTGLQALDHAINKKISITTGERETKLLFAENIIVSLEN